MLELVKKGFGVKGLVLYRSFFGNTKTVAEHMAQTIGGLGLQAVAQDFGEKLRSCASRSPS